MPYPAPRPAAPNGPGLCPRCFASVIWCVTEKQRAQMVDPDPNDKGNQAVHQDVAGRWRVRQLSGERPSVEGAEHLHMPHVATCTAPAAPRRTTTPARMSSARARKAVRPVRWQR
ncbi:hypothetical protein ABZX77_40630 [Streptomyces sp. NPDC004237]|uniref:hypothetical protein n=1 Tax=Streptomyces sp. NPDC004237 TaxID=3154455 RepID=UPI0033BEB8D6